MKSAGTAAPVGVTGNLEGGDGDTRRRTAGREGPDEARRHHSRAHGPKNRCGGTLASRQTFLSAQICRSGETLNNAQPVSDRNLATDQAIEEDAGKPMPVVLLRCASPGEKLVNTNWAPAQIPDTRSTASRTLSDPRSLPVDPIQDHCFWIPNSRTGGNRNSWSTPKKW